MYSPQLSCPDARRKKRSAEWRVVRWKWWWNRKQNKLPNLKKDLSCATCSTLIAPRMLVTKLGSSHRRALNRYSQPAFTLPEITKATQQFSQSECVMCKYWWSAEEYQKALPLLERSIQICEQIFGPTATLTIPLKEMVGEANVKLGKHTLAERTLQQLLGAYKTKWGL